MGGKNHIIYTLLMLAQTKHCKLKNDKPYPLMHELGRGQTHLPYFQPAQKYKTEK